MAKKKSDESGNSYLVNQPFRDKDNFDILYEVGADVGHFEQERLDELVEKGLIVKGDEAEEA
jgi:hypothetical protein